MSTVLVAKGDQNPTVGLLRGTHNAKDTVWKRRATGDKKRFKI